jgi:hypothetical protein
MAHIKQSNFVMMENNFFLECRITDVAVPWDPNFVLASKKSIGQASHYPYPRSVGFFSAISIQMFLSGRVFVGDFYSCSRSRPMFGPMGMYSRPRADQYSTTKVVTRKRKRKKIDLFLLVLFGVSLLMMNHCEARKENCMPITTLRVPSVF